MEAAAGLPERAVGERREIGERASSRGVPDPELAPKARRRQFTAEYKLQIVLEAERCSQPGEIGALLRREGLYSSLLTQWRQARDSGALHAWSRASAAPADPRPSSWPARCCGSGHDRDRPCLRAGTGPIA